jgi:Protein of unknown function (DUF4236)/Bacterial SH3 domain
VPFYLRKSVRAGPFRFNLSNSGVGVSVGVKGLRIGTGPRGHYVHAGRGGLYYRASLGGAHRTPSPRNPLSSSQTKTYAEQGVTMIEVQSGDVAAMRDATVTDLVEDLNKKQAQLPLGILAACGFAFVAAFLMLLQFNPNEQSVRVMVGSVVLLSALPGWAIGEWFDSYKRTSVLIYNLEETSLAAYRKVTEGFDALALCHGQWHIASGGAVLDLTTWKRNAGAAHLVDRKNARLAYSLPKVLRSNITPPTITLSSRVFFFLPDVVLVKQYGRFGAIGYNDLRIRTQTSRFIEDGSPPADAQVVDRTWKHPNKSGGPDRRFRDNRLLPVCLYEVMHLSSTSGANELMEFSRTGIVQAFAAALHDLPHRQAPDSLNSLALLLGDSTTPERNKSIVEESSTNKSSNWIALAGAVSVIAVVLAVASVFAWRGSLRTSTETHDAVVHSPSVPAAMPTLQPFPAEPIAPPRQASAPPKPTLPSLPIVTVRTPANIRVEPNSAAAIVRLAASGEKFSVFGRANGWVRVGLHRPLGWIAAALLTE